MQTIFSGLGGRLSITSVAWMCFFSAVSSWGRVDGMMPSGSTPVTATEPPPVTDPSTSQDDQRIQEQERRGVFADDRFPTSVAFSQAPPEPPTFTDSAGNAHPCPKEPFEQGFREGAGGQRFSIDPFVRAYHKVPHKNGWRDPLLPEFATQYSRVAPERRACQRYRDNPEKRNDLACCTLGFRAGAARLAEYLHQHEDSDTIPEGQTNDLTCRANYKLGIEEARRTCEHLNLPCRREPPTDETSPTRYLGCYFIGFSQRLGQGCPEEFQVPFLHGNGRMSFLDWLSQANRRSHKDNVGDAPTGTAEEQPAPSDGGSGAGGAGR